MTIKEKARKSGTRTRSNQSASTVRTARVRAAPIMSDPIVEVEDCNAQLHAADPAASSEIEAIMTSEPGIRGPRDVRDLLAIGFGQVQLLSFRVGREMFAIDLACVEEAVESDAVHAVPDMPEAMLGVIELRGRLVPVFSPSHVLRAELSGADAVMLLMRAGDRRVGIAVDDVEDVIIIDMDVLRRPMLDDAGDGLLIGVAAMGSGLVGILDGPALVAACTGRSLPEAA